MLEVCIPCVLEFQKKLLRDLSEQHLDLQESSRSRSRKRNNLVVITGHPENIIEYMSIIMMFLQEYCCYNWDLETQSAPVVNLYQHQQFQSLISISSFQVSRLSGK